MKKKIAFFLVFSCSLLAGCSHLLTLQKSGAYHRSDERIDFSYTIDETREKEIREYFTKNTGLDLEAINKKESDMEKVLLIADFISKNIPHANQKSPIKKQDAISLWEYHLNTENAFNCRFHSMMTCELLLSVGVVNNYVWCMPKSSTDDDCHVVNNVWISELHKWVMVDTDMRAYIVDKNNTPLSIQEIRENLKSKNFTDLNIVKIAPMIQSPKDYLDYLAKDFYWFRKFQTIRFIGNEKRLDGHADSKLVNLLPMGYSGFDLDDVNVIIITNDDTEFWKVIK